MSALLPSFAAPGFLLAAAGVLWPLAAHLWHRPAKSRVMFPNLDPLLTADAGPAGRRRLRDRLRLLVRCLTVLLIALALARPYWPNTADAATSLGDRTAVVIVLDVSASTRQRLADGRSAAEWLMARADAAVSGLTVGRDRAGVVLADANPAALGDGLTANLDWLRASLVEHAKATDQPADLSAAVALAGRLLSEAGPGRRRVLLLTDGQTPAPAAPPGVEMQVVQTPPPDPAGNVALTQTAAATPHVRTGQPIELSVTVSHFIELDESVGPSYGRRRVMVTLQRDGQDIDRRGVELEPNHPQTLTFRDRPPADATGPVVYRWSLPAGDALAHDDEAALILDVLPRPRVLLFDPSDTVPERSAARLTGLALAPHGDERDPVITEQVGNVAGLAARLAEAEVLVTTRRALQNQTTRDAVEPWLERGGRVLLWGAAIEATDDVAAAAAGPLTLGVVERMAPIFRGWDAASFAALRRVRWGARSANMSDQTTPWGERVSVWMRDAVGRPMLSEWRVGSGRVVKASYSPAAAGSDLAQQGIFVPLVRGCVGVLLDAEAPVPVATAGDPLRLSTNAIPRTDGPPPRLLGPDGEEARAAEYALARRPAEVTLPVAERAGTYRLMQGTTELAAAAVAVDPRESDLRRVAEEKDRADGNDAELLSGSLAALTEPSTPERAGRAARSWLLVATLGLLALDSWPVGRRRGWGEAA
jgi:hypothetical protein